MPITRLKRGREESEEDNKKASSSKKQKSDTKVYYEYDNIGYISDQWHTLIRSIPFDLSDLMKVMSEEVCSFLNGSGGILCFGCRSNGKIYGEKVNRKEEDNLRLQIDEMMRKFHPFVSPKHYRVYFTPVESHFAKFLSPRVILEIKVERGDMYELYETCDEHEVFLRKDGSPYGPLTPHEIKRHVVQLYRKKLDNSVELRNSLQKLQPKKKAIVNPHLQTSKDHVTSSKDAISNKPSHPLSVCKTMKTTMAVSNPSDVMVTIASSISTSTVNISLPQPSNAKHVTTTITHLSSPNVFTASNSLKTTTSVTKSNSGTKTHARETCNTQIKTVGSKRPLGEVNSQIKPGHRPKIYLQKMQSALQNVHSSLQKLTKRQ